MPPRSYATHKRCARCGELKIWATDFYLRWHSYCKPCNIAVALEWRKKNRERYLSNERPKSRAYKRANPEKCQAHKAVAKALANGTLKKPTNCEICGVAAKLHGHHQDYSRQLAVVWLCPRCHKNLHQEMKRSATHASESIRSAY